MRPPGDVRGRVADALDELNRLRCADAAARRAIEAVRLTARTLEYFWLPTLSAAEPQRSVDAGGRQAVDLGPAEQPRQA